jgi:RNA polymerase sigma factor (sigma-70 family)
MTDDLAALLIKRCRAVAYKMCRAAGSFMHYDDLVSEGLKRALEAEPRFKPDGGASLPTFLMHNAAGAMLDWLRTCDRLNGISRNRLKTTVHIDAEELLRTATEKTARGLSRRQKADLGYLTTASPEAVVNAQLDAAAVLNRLHIPPKHRERTKEALRRYWLEDETPAEIAASLGIHRTAISNSLHLGLTALRNNFASN